MSARSLPFLGPATDSRNEDNRDPEHVVHVVDHDQRSRADLARMLFGIDLHAEVYASLRELIAFHPQQGVILFHQCEEDVLANIITRISEAGLILPLVVAKSGQCIEWAVSAIRAGAIECLPLPAEPHVLRAVIGRALDDATRNSAARKKLLAARQRIGALTPREREVLDWLTEGLANKEIAHQLNISPRTVEIHRANMMAKLGAKHPAQAVRLRLQSKIEANWNERACRAV